MEKKKPSFKRQYSSYKKRGKVQTSWRKPRGIDSKQRKHKKAKGAHPRVGYGSPRVTRGMHPKGKHEVLVRNMKDVESLNKDVLVRISATVGEKKRKEIIAICEKKGIEVINR
ncbi:MAG: 50S ribosomal protein L32e [Candidatus Diapherotrites archaeon]|nr:50S ribosomal protein L32e [Candidatus Diapherotrites archaeon]